MYWFEDTDDHAGVSPSSHSQSTQSGTNDPLRIECKLDRSLCIADLLDELTVRWSRGLRFSDLNVDRGTVTLGAPESGWIQESGVVLMEQGENLFANKRFTDAVESYTTALKHLIRIRDNGELLGRAFNLRSETYRKLGKNKEALEDAVAAIKCFPTLTKGAANAACALEALGTFNEAYDIAARALQIFNFQDKIGEVELLAICVRLAPKLPDAFEHLNGISKISKSTWNQVLVKFAKEGAWSSVRVLLMGTDEETALMSSCDAVSVPLTGLLDTCRELSWTQWGQKLALLLLKYGAKHTSICPDHKFPFHVALRIGLKTESFDLLKWLLKNKPSETTVVDQNGNSLLHITCRSKSKARSTALKLLLNHQVDPSLKNNEKKVALDYLPSDSADREILEKKNKEKLNSGELKNATTGPKTTSDAKTQQAPNSNTVINTSDFDFVTSWSKARVTEWLVAQGLEQHKQKFCDIDGHLLFELRMMQITAPEVFFKILESALELPVLDILRLSSALRSLSSDAQT